MEKIYGLNLQLTSLLGILLVTTPVMSQIKTDGSLGPSVELTGSKVEIDHSLGKIRGNNLFHSFSEFNIQSGGSATFTGPNSVQSILSRVTGANDSFINGEFGSTIPGANVFFMNPNGVRFGPKATLNVSGSFIVTTADSLKFADGAEFHTNLTKASQLSVAGPAAFGFLNGNPNPITVSGSTLAVQPNKRLSFIGGDIDITGASLNAPSGRVTVASLDSAGTVTSDVSRFVSNDDVLIVPDNGQINLGQVNISDSSTIDAGGDGGGNVIIRGGRFTLNNNARLWARSTRGAGGRIGIYVDDLTATQTSQINASSDRGGNGGSITINANEAITLSNSAISNRSVGNVSGGTVELTTKILNLVEGARINSTSVGPKDGGNIRITATETITLANSSIFNRAIGRGDAGATSVRARNLYLQGGAQINSSSPQDVPSADFTPGDGGRIRIEITDSISISDSAIVSQTQRRGNAGEISMTATNLIVTDGGLIRTSTIGEGKGGEVNITATDTVTISGKNNTGRLSGIFSNSEINEDPTIVGGNGGDIVVQSGNLVLSNGGLISANSETAGDAGGINIQLRNHLLSENGTITTASTMADGGDIVIHSNNQVHLTNSSITAEVNGGPSTVGGNITMSQKSAVLAGSRIVARASEGSGGNISITADVFMADPDSIVSASSELGNDGNVDILAAIINTAGNMVPLEREFLSAPELLSAPCEVRLNSGMTSSFLLSGRQGLPTRPGAMLSTLFIFGEHHLLARRHWNSDPYSLHPQ